MRQSCNFINVYTTAYRVQYTFTRVHARILITDILARKIARVGRQVGEDVRVGVGVVECQLKRAFLLVDSIVTLSGRDRTVVEVQSFNRTIYNCEYQQQ